MQYSITAIATLAAAFAALAPSPVIGALQTSCFPTVGCKTCASSGDMTNFAGSFCRNDISQDQIMAFGIGYATLVGSFPDEKTCEDNFNTITEKCFGQEDGGIMVEDGLDGATPFRLNVGFCGCE
ncbi:hypothetical protein C2E23DRAFT_740165 [Lenzites betulinus]|nr:hypothetical protein C2E23DRAFT_740165 [Lenzites betulinus]